ncbi:hypothetical protein D3C86_609390 [compost metagenome]
MQACHTAGACHCEWQGQPLLLAVFKGKGAGQLAVCLEPAFEGPGKGEGLILAAHVAQLHQGPGLIPASTKTRPANFGHQGRHYLDGALGLPHLLFVPGQRHQRQLAVEVGQIERDHRLALFVETHLAAPERSDLDPALQCAPLLQGRGITAVVEASQLAVLGRDHLTVVVEQVLCEALATEEDLERVEWLVVADIEHAPVHRRQHHPPLTVGGGGSGHFEPGERHGFIRRAQGERQAASLSVQRQRHQADRAQALNALAARRSRLAVRDGDLGRDMEIMTLPLGADGDLELATPFPLPGAFGVQLDALPPAQAVAIFHQQQPLARTGSDQGYFRLVSGLIGTFVEGDGNLVGPRLLATAAPGVTADLQPQAGLMALAVLHLEAIPTGRKRQAEGGRPLAVQLQGLLLLQIGLAVELVLPPLAVGVVPVVVAVLVDQAHLHLARHRLALVVEVEDLEGERFAPLYPLCHEIGPEGGPLAVGGPAVLGTAAIDGAATGLGERHPVGHLQRPEGTHAIQLIHQGEAPLPLLIESETPGLEILGLLGEQHVP